MSKNKLKIVYYAVSSVQFSNPAKLSGSVSHRISAGFGKSAGFRPEPEPKSGTALQT